jgi:hypothetical protein
VVVAGWIWISLGCTTEEMIPLVKENRPAARLEEAHYRRVIEDFEAAWMAILK